MRLDSRDPTLCQVKHSESLVAATICFYHLLLPLTKIPSKLDTSNKVLIYSFILRVPKRGNVNFVDKFWCPEGPGLNSLYKLSALSLHAPPHHPPFTSN
jgi:hypothetical protein